jgi:DNA 3'-phosphatase
MLSSCHRKPTNLSLTCSRADLRVFIAQDFDDTLVPRGARDGSTRAVLPRDLMYASVPAVLRRLHDSEGDGGGEGGGNGFRIVVVTNEANISRYKKPAAIHKIIKSKTQRLQALADYMAPLPILIMCATKKDRYRKGEGTGLVDAAQELSQAGVVIDATSSFVCGDAAGRRGDFSDSDRTFATAAGLAFFTPQEIFAGDGSVVDRVCGEKKGEASAAAETEGGGGGDAGAESLRASGGVGTAGEASASAERSPKRLKTDS